MAKKATLTDVSSGYQQAATFNNNFDALNNQFDNTLSLDGSAPNAMGADLDLNDNDLLNVNVGYFDAVSIGGQLFTGAGSDISNLIITGDLTVGGDGYISDYIYHTGDLNTFFGFPAADTFTITTSGTEALRVASSGNVGIGVVSPTVRLDVSGTIAARGNLVAGSDTLVGSKFHVNSTTGVTRAQGAIQISNALAGREGYLTLSNGTNATSTALWTLSVDSTDSNSFYLWDDVNSSYPFAVTPGANSGVLVVDGANDRVGVGTTTPTHPLTVNGDVAITGSIIHSGDTNTSLGFPANDTITFTTSGAEAMRVASSGNVGIGLTNPNVKLDVSGTIAARGNFVAGSDTAVGSNLYVNSTTNRVGVNTASPDESLHVSGTLKITPAITSIGEGLLIDSPFAVLDNYLTFATAGTKRWAIAVDAAGGTPTNALYIWDDVNDTYPFAILPGANSETLVVDGATDRVGIGTSSPTHPLTVNGEVAITGNIVHSGDTNTNFGFPANDTIAFTTAGAEAVRVTSSGNVGVGLTSPTVKLDVSGTVAARGNLVAGSDTLVGSSFHVNSTTNVTRAQGAIQISNALAGRESYLTLSNGTNATSTALWTLSVDSTATNSFYMWDDVNSRYHFAIKPGTATSGTLVVDGTNGRVGIGASSPTTALDVVGTVKADGVSLGDNDKAIFGAGSDLEIYHDGSNSIIADTGTGNLSLLSNGAKIGLLSTATTSEFMIECVTDGAVSLYYDGSKKLATANGGVEVTGNLEVDTDTLYVNSGSNRVGIRNSSPNAPLHVIGATRIQNVLAGREGFLEMYSGSGAGSALWTLSIDSTASNAFYLWDEQNSSYPFAVIPGVNSDTLVVNGSTDRVGIGTSSPSVDLHISSANPIVRTQDTDGTNQYADFRNTGGITIIDSRNNTSNGEIRFRGQDGTSTNEYARFNSSGSFGIGTTSPSAKLDVNGAIKSQSFLTTGQGIDITRGDGAAFGVRIENPSGTAFVYNADGGHFFYNRAETVTHGSFTSSAVIFPAAYSATTALGTNVRVISGGQLLRSTSSLKYKHNVEDADLALSEAVVYGSRPVWYQSLSDLDNDAWGFWGFIAEELHEVDPRLVDYGEDENGDPVPDGVQYDRFVVHLVNVAQQQKAKIDDLESRLAALEATSGGVL